MQYTQQIYSDDKKLIYAWFEAMHTRIDIAFSTEIVRNDLVEIVNEMEAELIKYEAISNRFNPQSEISFVNDNAFENEISISVELCNLLTECELHSEQTNRFFDISVYSTVGLRNNAKAFTLNTNAKTIQFSHAGVLLDLSGFIKGYALGKLMEIADKNGIYDILINIGNSSIYAKGNHPFGTGWKIKIPETDCECVLMNECLTTSGNSDSSKWPIMNPQSGEIAKNKKPVSVLTKSPSVGEALSKVAYLATESELNVFLKQYEAQIIAT